MIFVLLILMAALAPGTGQGAAINPAIAIRHRMLLADEGNGAVLLSDENGGPEWAAPVPGNGLTPAVGDMQPIGNDRVLVNSIAGGYLEYDLRDGSLKKRVQGFGAVQSARRLPDGRTLLAGNDLEGAHGIVVLELDAQDQQVGMAVFPDLSTVRLLRLTASGHLLFGSNSKVLEADMTGRILWQAEVPGAVIYKALRLPGGNTWVSTGYLATLVLLGPSGKVLKTLGGASLPKEVGAHFFGDFKILPDGGLMVANWQNHGPGHGGEGVQLLEFDSTGTLRWQYRQDPARISSLVGVIVLDGMDTRLGQDETEGMMAPWKTGTALGNPRAGRSTRPGRNRASPASGGSGQRTRDTIGRSIPGGPGIGFYIL